MTTRDHEPVDTGPVVRRVLLAMFPGGTQHRPMDLATRLAQRLNAELAALMVEDSALLQAAALPFTREILHGSGEEREITVNAVERSLRGEARRIREALVERAQTRGVRSSFSTCRGVGHIEVLRLLEPGDLLVTARLRRSMLGESQPGTVIVLHREDQEQRRDWQALSATLSDIGDPAVAHVWEELVWSEPQQLVERLRRKLPGLVVLPAQSDPGGELLRALLDALECPLLLVP